MQMYPIETDSITSSWVAIDQMVNYPKTNKKAGSFACRQLLQNAQQYLNLTGALVDTNFPYHFFCNHRKYYVSFSHSREHIAVLISPYHAIGIDVEDRVISQQVAMRFFSPNECEWIAIQPLSMQPSLRGFFWRLKECYIKARQSTHSVLTSQLKNDLMLQIGKSSIQQLTQMDNATTTSQAFVLCKLASNIIGNFQQLPCSFVIVED